VASCCWSPRKLTTQKKGRITSNWFVLIFELMRPNRLKSDFLYLDIGYLLPIAIILLKACPQPFCMDVVVRVEPR
jgi:hypothetical protein